MPVRTKQWKQASWLLSLCIIALRLPVALGQPAPSRVPPASSTPETVSTPTGANGNPLEFDVVSIRRNPAEMGPATAKFDFSATGDGLSVTDIVLSSIIGTFYDHPQESQAGMPSWADSECYDIRAKIAERDLDAYHGLTKEQRRQMVRKVLEDRFKLRLHLEQKEAPMYALRISKHGLRISEAKPGQVYTSGPKGPDGKFQSSLFMSGPGEESANAVNMSLFASSLSEISGRPVRDETGLAGNYNFTFKWNAELTETDAPSLFTALEEQLGLRLDPIKGSIPILVIDHIERPSVN